MAPIPQHLDDHAFPDRMRILTVLLMFVAILSTRLPGAFFNVEMNKDESALLGMASPARIFHGVPWQDYDAATTGPVTLWFLATALALGIPATYAGLHLLAALIWAATCSLACLTAGKVLGRLYGYFCLAATLCISATAQLQDYMHFSTEAVPALLVVAAGLGLVSGVVRPSTTGLAVAAAGLAGLLLGLSVLCKLQVLPVAAFLMLSTWAPAVRGQPRKGFACFLAAVGGAGCPLGLMAAYLHRHGILHEAWGSYVIATRSYAGLPGTSAEWFRSALESVVKGWRIFPPVFAALITALCVAVLFVRRDFFRQHQEPVLVALFFSGWFAAGLAAVLLPAYRFDHHGLLLLVPSLLALTSWVRLSTSAAQAGPPGCGTVAAPARRLPGLCLGMLVVFAVPQLDFAVRNVRQLQFEVRHPQPSFAERVAKRIAQLVPPEGQIFIWGWAPEIYLLSGRVNATRYQICHFLIYENAYRDHHRRNLMQDLSGNPPYLIVDGTAPGLFSWPWSQEGAARMETFPLLSAFVQKNYRLVEEMRCRESDPPVRLYLRLNLHD